MPKSVLRQTALFMLVIFLTSLVVFGFSGARLAHQIDHEGKIEMPAGDHVHVYSAAKTGDADAVSDTTEHQVLHAVDHIQLFPDTGSMHPVAATAASIVPSHFADQLLPLAGSDLPFRPPRSNSFPA